MSCRDLNPWNMDYVLSLSRFTRDLGSYLCHGFDFRRHFDFFDLMLNHLLERNSIPLKSIVAYRGWMLWRHKNNIVFHFSISNPRLIAHRSIHLALEFVGTPVIPYIGRSRYWVTCSFSSSHFLAFRFSLETSP